MSLILLLAIFFRAVLVFSCFALYRRVRDWRIGFIFVLMLISGESLPRELYTAWDGWAIRVFMDIPNILSIVMSLMALLIVYFIGELILEQKRTVEAVKESEERYRLLTENMRDIVWTADAHGRFTYISPSFEKLTGLTVADLMGKHIATGLGHGSGRFASRMFERAVGGEDMEGVFEVVYKNAKGESRWFEVNAVTVRDTNNRIKNFQGITRDISERKAAEKTLKESQARLATAQRIAHLGSWIWELQTGKVTLTDEAYRIFGIEKEDFNGRIDEIEARFHPEDAQRVKEIVDVTVREARSFWAEYRIVRPNGDIRMVQSQGETSKDRKGRAKVCVGTILDVTERKQAELERARLEAQMQQTQKLESLGVLAGGIAHDFNNFLAGILGYSSLVLKKLPKDSAVTSHVQQIETAAKHASDLTRQMLAYSGRGKFEVGRVKLSNLVEDIGHLLEVAISKKVSLEYDLHPNLPVIVADMSQVQQVVMNLITNASDAIGDNKGSISITTGVLYGDTEYLKSTFVGDELEEGEFVYLEVADSGAGMDQATQEKIFDPFFTTKFTGRGLGLAAVLGIMRGHNGTIDVKSAPGEGTTFRAVFPVGGPAFDSEPPDPDEMDGWRGKGTILVVDDEEIVRNLSRDVLEHAGFDVLTASDGQEAIETYQNHGQDILVVVLDLTMPKLSGEETFKSLRELNGDVRVVLSSGYNEQEVVDRFVGESLTGFLQKPFEANHLLSKMREVLER